MPDRTLPAVLRGTRGTISVAIVLALAGLLFVANAHLAQGTDQRHPQNLADLATTEEARVARLQGEVRNLRTEVDRLAAEQVRLTGLQIGAPAPGFDVAAGHVAVTGPGITVQVSDAPASSQNLPNVRPDDLVVHQQDVQAVINALWAGGAEAMTLMDQRVISTSAFQCIGNVLSLQGRRYSPPYVIRAIGDPRQLRAALAAAPDVKTYLRWVDAVGLGWQVTTAQGPLELPAYDGSTELVNARVPAGVDVLPIRTTAEGSGQ